MFKNKLSHYHIRFQKKNRLHVLGKLLLLLLFEQVWKIKKYRKGIRKPVIHLYAICWNEAKILPFMLQHYASFVDHFHIYDNYSDDDTDRILQAYPNVTVHKFDTGGEFNEYILLKIRDNAWKQSRGKADWVIMVDTDELIYHPDILSLLHTEKYTIYRPFGFNMVTDTFPSYDLPIIKQVKLGIPDESYSKMALFNPYKIVEVHYTLGSHEAFPEGIFKKGVFDDLKLLHYKNIGIAYVLYRVDLYRKRVSEEHLKKGINTHYTKQKDQIEKEINKALKEAVYVIET